MDCYRNLLRNLVGSQISRIQDPRVLSALQSRTLHQGDLAYLRISDPAGSTRLVKVVGYGIEGKKVLPRCLLEDGTDTFLDLSKTHSFEVSDESRYAWHQKHKELEDAYLKKKIDQGDLQYLTESFPGTPGVRQARVIGYGKLKGTEMPILLYPDGRLRFLSFDNLKHVFSSSESRKRWLGVLDSGEWVEVEKNLRELPKSREELIRRARKQNAPSLLPSGPGPYLLDRASVTSETGANFEVRLLDEETSIPRVRRLSESLDQKFGVKAAYSREVLATQKWRGFFHESGSFLDPEGRMLREKKPIAVFSENVESDLIGDTEIHEIGHAKTHHNLDNGKPDPLGISFKAPEGKSLPTGEDYGIKHRSEFYQRYSQSDESRQHAYNFHNAVHQRKTSEVIRDFHRRGKLSCREAFGVNLKNFHESMTLAESKLTDVKLLNFRHTDLALEAQKEVSEHMNPRRVLNHSNYEFEVDAKGLSGAILIQTARAKTRIPIIGNAFERFIKPVIQKTSSGEIKLDFAGKTRLIHELRTYSLDYLGNQLSMLDHQFEALLQSEIQLTRIRANPETLLSLEEYLEAQSAFTRVKGSVNYSPEKTRNLSWVDPAGAE